MLIQMLLIHHFLELQFLHQDSLVKQEMLGEKRHVV